jgi:hypothetical protein
MSSPEDSHAKTSVEPEKEKELLGRDPVSGQRCFDSSEMCGQRGQLLKMYQPFDLRDLPWSFKISARSGIALNGIVFPLVPLARLTRGTGSGSWPTPCSNTRPNEGNVRLLRAKVEAGELSREEAKAMLNGKDPFEAQGVIPQKMWPTPTSRDWKDGSAQACKNVPANCLLGREVHARKNYQTSGALNPTWVEWLMGFPSGWTDLNNSATP